MKAAVYRNLHKSCWSVRNRSTGRVQMHLDYAVVRDCTFRVGNAGRERVVREGRKNVHAGVFGILDENPPQDPMSGPESWIRVTYNPYRNTTFVDESGNPVTHASTVVLLPDAKVYATGIR